MLGWLANSSHCFKCHSLSPLKCEPNHVTPLLKILPWFPCLGWRLLSPAWCTGSFQNWLLLTCWTSSPVTLLGFPHKSTCFSPTGHFSLDARSCLCPSLYPTVLFHAYRELPIYLRRLSSIWEPSLVFLSQLWSTFLCVVLLSSHCIVIICLHTNLFISL